MYTLTQIYDAMDIWQDFPRLFIERGCASNPVAEHNLFDQVRWASRVLMCECERRGLDGSALRKLADMGFVICIKWPEKLDHTARWPWSPNDPDMLPANLVEQAVTVMDRLCAKLDCEGNNPHLPHISTAGKAVAKFIIKHPGRSADQISEATDLSSGDVVRTIIKDQLKAHGFRTGENGRGYYPPNPITDALTVALR